MLKFLQNCGEGIGKLSIKRNRLIDVRVPDRKGCKITTNKCLLLLTLKDGNRNKMKTVIDPNDLKVVQINLYDSEADTNDLL